jgi:hypothetical protein
VATAKQSEPEEEPTVSVTAHFERKITDGDYGSKVASIFITEKFSGTVDAEAIAEVAQSQFQVIKSEVFSQLGIEFEQDEETGRIVELFPGTTVVESKKAKPAPRKQSARKAEPEPEEEELEEEEEEERPRRAAPARKAAPRRASRDDSDEDPDGHWQDLMDNPGNWEFIDDKRSDRSPDFQHLTKKRPGTNFKMGLWLNNAPDWFENPFEDAKPKRRPGRR